MTDEMTPDSRGGHLDAVDITSRVFLNRFRCEVDLLAGALEACPVEHAAWTIEQGLDQAAIRVVLAAAYTEAQDDAFAEDMVRTVEDFVPTGVSSARDIPGLAKVRLLAALDTAWWGSAPSFQTDDEVTCDRSLVDLRRARSRGALGFAFRTQAFGPLPRAARAADRRLLPGRTPSTIGMRLPYARQEMIDVLNSIAAEFSRWAPSSPRLWVNSIVRSVAYQEDMRGSGYTAAAGSAHCAGWAADIEMAWMVRKGYGEILADVLRSRAEAAQLNVIDEGQAWHVCLNPAVVQPDSGILSCAG